MLGARPFLRRIIMFAAAVQVLLPSAASVADGLLQREDRGSSCDQPHVELFGSKSCRPIHTDDCTFCRVVTATASPANGTALPSFAIRARVAPPRATSERLRAIPHVLPASRAPPVLDGVASARA